MQNASSPIAPNTQQYLVQKIWYELEKESHPPVLLLTNDLYCLHFYSPVVQVSIHSDRIPETISLVHPTLLPKYSPLSQVGLQSASPNSTDSVNARSVIIVVLPEEEGLMPSTRYLNCLHPTRKTDPTCGN